MSAELALRLGLGMVMIVFGIDQLRKWQAWASFVPGWLTWVEFPTEKLFWRAHALINIFLALVLFSGFYLRFSSIIVTAWLATIAFVTLFTDWQAGIRDLGLTAGALALAFIAWA